MFDSISVCLIPRSRSSKVKVIQGQGHPQGKGHFVSYSDVYSRLVNRADGLEAATTVIGPSNVYLTQSVTQWPFPTVKVKVIGGQGYFRIKVISRSRSSKVKVIWSHTNALYKVKVNTGHPKVKVIKTSRSSQGGHFSPLQWCLQTSSYLMVLMRQPLL